MLIYRIVRVIRDKEYRFICNLSCIVPSGNRYIDVVLVGFDDGLKEVQKIKLDPKAPKEISFATIPENGT
jgi:hypothetical protein